MSSSSPIAAVAFDFDGTLADTRGAIVATVHDTLHALGLASLAEEIIVAHIGLPLVEVFRAAGVERPHLASAVHRYRETFPRHAHRVVLFPGVQRCLQALHDRGLRLGVASSRGRTSLLSLVATLGLAPLLHEVLGDEDAVRKKPAPDLVLSLAERWSLSPGQLLVVGDTSFDIEMGVAAGARTCGVTHGSHGPEALRKAGAGVLIDHLEQLHAHLPPPPPGAC